MANKLADKDIAIGILNGDTRCEAELAAKFRKGLVSMLLGRTHNSVMAEDLAQETLLTVIRRLRTRGIDHPEQLTAFIYQTAKFVHLSTIRKHSVSKELSGLDQESDAGVDLEEETIRNEMIAKVRDVIDEMKVERDREILHRFYVKDQTKNEICDYLELSTENFDRVISRARQRFAELLKAREMVH
jgi:RNA polymerase sigma-70 factor (ECF subfamily)